jgi:predicted nucleic acid-binding protein
MIVIDASVAVEVLLRTPIGMRAAPHIFHEMRHAPHLIDVEFAHALRRLACAGLGHDISRSAIRNMRAWDVERHAHLPFLPRIWELRDSVTAYDASYIALAEALGAPLITCDGKMSRAHGHRAEIVLIT